MRAGLTIVGLVVVLAIIGALIKKQITAVPATPSPLPAAGPALPPTGLTGPMPGTVQPPSSPAPATTAPAQLQQQYKQALDAAMQQTRPVPDDAK